MQTFLSNYYVSIFSISANNESLLSDCRAEKKYQEILFLITEGGNTEGYLH